jgi:RNA polymerase sporulation-specific sigma factor
VPSPPSRKSIPRDFVSDTIAAHAKGGDKEAVEDILRRLTPIAHHLVRNRQKMAVGIDAGDLTNVAMTAICACLHNWDEEKSSFKTFASVAIDRAILTEIDSAKRRKYQPLNEAFVSSTTQNSDQGQPGQDYNVVDDYIELIRDPKSLNEFEMVVERVAFRETYGPLLGQLTHVERIVFSDMLDYPNEPYGERGARLGLKPKTVDNATLRIRKKLRLEVG